MVILVIGNSRFFPFVDPIINVPLGITDISGQFGQSLKLVPGMKEPTGSFDKAIDVLIIELNSKYLTIETCFNNSMSFKT